MPDLSLHILQHALGLDDYGRGKYDKRHHARDTYRNRFVTGPDCDNWNECLAHVEAGRMKRHGPSALFGSETNGYCFTVTEAGIAHVIANSPKPPKLPRSKQRYQDYLDSDSDLKFGEWLKMRRA